MQPISAHRKETLVFLGGGLLFLLLFFGGIISLRTGIISISHSSQTATKNVDQIIGEMHGTITAQAAATAHTLLMMTATSLELTTQAPTPTYTPTPTQEPAMNTTRISSVDGMRQVYIPSGSFIMGSNGAQANVEPQEKPQHSVDLAGFWMDQTEVTRGMYKRCIKSKNCPDISSELMKISGFDDEKNDGHPIVLITWEQARVYCERVGRRLPTEAEWEKAARGTDGRTYPWGETPIDGNLALYGKAVNGTRPVDAYPAGMSPYGILNMIGNAAEWVFDTYSADYYSLSPLQNPLGPDTGDQKVIRGSSWKDDISQVRISRRSFDNLNSKDDDRGFRCASSN